MTDLLVELMSIFYILTIIILISGTLLKIFRKPRFDGTFIYLSALLLLELCSRLIKHFSLAENNLYFFSISAFLHYAFLIYFFYKQIQILKPKIAPIIFLILGAVLFLIGISQNLSASNFNSYDRATFSFIITILTLVYFYFITLGKLKYKKHDFLLNIAVFLFFATDTFLAIGSNILVNENLELVAGFWMFRALFLQLYYISLIYHTWQTGKTPPLPSNG